MSVRDFLRILCLSVLPAAAVEAPPPTAIDAQALREQFQSRQQQIKTWSASFTQTLVVPGMRQPVVSQGTLVYRAPEQLKLDFIKPSGEFVLVVGDHFYLKKAGKPVVLGSLADDFAGKPFQALLSLLRGQPTEEETLYLPEVSRQPGKYRVVLNRKPDAPGRLPKRITNTIDANSLEVREVLVELPEGGTLKYRFDTVVRNGAIDGSRFAPPKPP